jgi:hypothetical protein
MLFSVRLEFGKNHIETFYPQIKPTQLLKILILLMVDSTAVVERLWRTPDFHNTQNAANCEP